MEDLLQVATWGLVAIRNLNLRQRVKIFSLVLAGKKLLLQLLTYMFNPPKSFRNKFHILYVNSWTPESVQCVVLYWSSFLAARLLSLALVWCRIFLQQCLVNASKAIKIKIFVVFTHLYSKFLFAKKSVDHVLYYTSRIPSVQANEYSEAKKLFD